MKDSKIAWTDHTFNPWWGCEKESPACKHCYAETFARRLGKSLWGPTADRPFASDSYWKQPLKWDREAASSGRNARVFCASMADVFEDRADLAGERARLFRLIEQTPHLDWLLLTKRAAHMKRLAVEAGWPGHWPENVWAGVTVESQRYAYERIPHLLQVPARVRFLSCEPLLEGINLDPLGCPYCGPSKDPNALWYDESYGAYRCRECGNSSDGLIAEAGHGHWLGFADEKGGINQVICGGESGPGARPFDLSWARSLRDQCAEAGTAFFMKQIGSNPVTSLGLITWPASDPKGGDMAEWPEDLRVQEFPTPAPIGRA